MPGELSINVTVESAGIDKEIEATGTKGNVRAAYIPTIKKFRTVHIAVNMSIVHYQELGGVEGILRLLGLDD